jgi:predicted methyltransferase
MKLNIKERLMLYALGRYYDISARVLPNEALAIHLPKSVFIDFVRRVELFDKGERAIYKNLEYLEDRKLVSYENRNLSLTERGQKVYDKVKAEIKPYFEMNKIIVNDRVKESKKLQTVFRFFK